MTKSRIAADHLTVAPMAGFPPAIDALAATARLARSRSGQADG
jgi:hypothetical protein